MAVAPLKMRQIAKSRAPQPQPPAQELPQSVMPAVSLPMGQAVTKDDFAAELAVTKDDRAEKLQTTFQDCQTAPEFEDEIRRLWGQTKVRFLLIGRYLIDAKRRLAHGEYEDFINKRLPFGPEVGRQIRAVAEAVYLEKRIQEEEVPPSYSIAYQIVTLPDLMLAKAREEGLLKEGVRRTDVISFKKRLAGGVSKVPTKQPDVVEKLLSEKKRLLARLVEIDRELESAGVIEGEVVRN